MDLKLQKLSTPKTDRSVSRFGRKITPKKNFDSSIDSDVDSEESEKLGIKSKRTGDKPEESSNKGNKSPKKIVHNDEERTPRNSKLKNAAVPKESVPPKTPYSLRQRLKTRIQNEVDKEEETPFDLSEESEWEESESESSESQEDEEELLAQVSAPSIPKHINPQLSTNRKSHYVCGSDYLEKASGKSNTSSHRLKKLEDIKEVTDALSSYIPSHDSHISSLDKHYQCLFYKWMYSLSKGYNVLVYGLGSKKSLLDQFGAFYLNSCKVLTVNGYFLGLTLKEILSSLFELLGKKTKETVEEFFSLLDYSKSRDIFLLVHNIDGVALRSDKTQVFLSQIASHSKVHMIASIDHINAPLMWDQKKLSRFNFIWEDCATFLPYSKEKNFENSLMVRTSANMALSSLRNVFRSLNKNSRNIFKFLMEHSQNPANKNTGMQFSELYRLCRRNFIVSSDLALRAQLTEFIDHQLVRWRKETDMLTISVDSDVLKTFKLEIESEGL